MKQHYKCTTSYDGTNFNGWQKQGNTSNTIQYTIEQTLSDMFDELIEIRGAGRTDAGVHATGQVFDFFTGNHIELKSFVHEINSRLPDTLRILDIEPVPSSFHSRKSALGKIYEYHIDTRFVPDVFTRKYSYWAGDSQFSPEAITRAVPLLCGTHDFTSFTTDKTPGKNHTRTISAINIISEGSHIILQFIGDGFLYNMVRIMAGTLIEVGRGKITPDSIQAILDAKDRSLSGFTAPPHGLFLKKIFY